MAGRSENKRRVPGTRILSDGTYEAILVVPADCVDLVRKKNLTKRLGTSRYAEAAKLAPPVLREFERVIAAARAGTPSPTTSIDPRKAVRAIEQWRHAELSRAELRAFNEPDAVIPDASTNWDAHLKFRVKFFELRDGLSRFGRWTDIPGFDDRLIAALAEHDIILKTEHPAMDRLRPIFQSAWYDVVKYEDDLRSGAVAPGETPVWSSPTTTPASTSSAVAIDTPTILETFDRWKADHLRAGGPKKTVGEYATQVQRFIDFRGNKRVSEVTRKDVIEFKDVMLNYPVRCPTELVGKGVTRIAAWGEENDDVRKLTAKTLNEKVLASLRAVFACAMARGDIEVNPAGGVRVKSLGQQSLPRLPYSAEDLKAIFSSPVFSQKLRPTGGAGDAAKWIPLLAVFAGARLEEIAIIETDDIKQDAGIGYIHFKTHNDDGTPRRVKNLFARRKVPIHSTLISLGFLKFVSQQKKRGTVRLFPDVRSKREKRSSAFGQWYGRYSRQYVPDKQKSFHSFRHTFKRALRDGKVEKTLRDAVMGHSHDDEAEMYGLDEDGQGFSLERLQEAVEAVSYPAVSFGGVR